VQVTKHMFKQGIVLEMSVCNTVSGVVLENIEMRLSGLEPNFTEVGASAITKLDYEQRASLLIVMKQVGNGEAQTGTFGATLHFLEGRW